MDVPEAFCQERDNSDYEDARRRLVDGLRQDADNPSCRAKWSRDISTQVTPTCPIRTLRPTTITKKDLNQLLWDGQAHGIHGRLKE